MMNYNAGYTDEVSSGWRKVIEEGSWILANNWNVRVEQFIRHGQQRCTSCF